MLAMALTFGIGLAGCNSSSLVGKWYETQAYANSGDESKLFFTLNSDKTCVIGTNSGTWNTSGSVLALTVGDQVLTYNYSISGTMLTLTLNGIIASTMAVFKPAN
jgi:hypothetical protein